MGNKYNLIIACGSLKPELEAIKNEGNGVRVEYMAQNLHRSPKQLKEHLQEKLDEIDQLEEVQQLVLGYGLCSGGIVGLKVPGQGLVIPKVHDCIALMMGSRGSFNAYFNQNPGTYHLTESWIENEKDPLGLLENEYTERVGREMAEDALRTELKNYTHISFINTGIGNEEKYRKRAQQNADFFGKQFLEIEGSGAYFRKMLYGPYDSKEFVHIEPYQIVNQKEFLK